MRAFDTVLERLAILDPPPSRVDVTPAFFADIKRLEATTAVDSPVKPQPLFGLEVVISHDVTDPRGFEFRYADGRKA